MSKETYTPWDSAEFLGDDESVVEYLRAALEESDPAFFVKAIGNVTRARGMSSIAQAAQLGRQNLYKALSGERDPRIGTLMKVLDSLGVQLSVAWSRYEKEIDPMSFRDANGNPKALHRRTICLLEELARRTGLTITKDRVLDGRCLHRPGKIAEKIGIETSDWDPNPEKNPGQRLWVSLWPANTAAQADCFYDEVRSNGRKANFLALAEQGWKIMPNSGFGFVMTALFGSETSLDTRGHLEYFFSGARPYGKYFFPGTGKEGKRELTPALIERWQRTGVISLEAQNRIEEHSKNRTFIDFKPGFWVYRIWELGEVIELEERGQLEAHIMQALDTPLGTWGEELERASCSATA